jgi:hypothetical protein
MGPQGGPYPERQMQSGVQAGLCLLLVGPHRETLLGQMGSKRGRNKAEASVCWQKQMNGH